MLDTLADEAVHSAAAATALSQIQTQPLRNGVTPSCRVRKPSRPLLLLKLLLEPEPAIEYRKAGCVMVVGAAAAVATTAVAVGPPAWGWGCSVLSVRRAEEGSKRVKLLVRNMGNAA